MRTSILSGLFGLAALIGTSAAAETCGGNYTVKSGDSLSLIADSQYKNVGMWSAIHSNNVGKMGDNPNALHVGMVLSLSCIDGLPVGLPGGIEQDAKPVSVALQTGGNTAATRQKINLLTGSDYAPFTDRNLPNGGLVTDVVNAAMTSADPEAGFAIHWVEDWGSHFDPLLSNALLDMGFPWYQPDCTGTPLDSRCENFLFSDPMFEILILLFTDSKRPIPFTSDDDLIGKRLCRPNGYFTHDLDRADRRWLANGTVTLEQPQTMADCFEMLMEGEVDAVAINEFTGRTTIKEMGLKDQVTIVQSRPLSIEGLHVLVHKTHPQAEELMSELNKGLDQIKEDGSYQGIIDSHLTRVWADF